MTAGIPLISNLIQANNGEFWIVDSNAIYGGLYHVDTIEQMITLPVSRLKQGMLCYVKDKDIYYKYMDKEWIEFTVSGGSSDNNYIIDELEIQKMVNIFSN